LKKASEAYHWWYVVETRKNTTADCKVNSAGSLDLSGKKAIGVWKVNVIARLTLFSFTIKIRHSTTWALQPAGRT
jgi:hypothetical protein